jgi:hypothetical protein
MAKCALHPGREAVATVFKVSYCEKCKAGIEAAVKKVDKHVEPKACFVWYAANDDWQPITGTGCAHWVAHEKGTRKGGAGEQCLAGFTFRVKTLLSGMSAVPLDKVKVGDHYASPSKDHTGLVIKVVPDPKNPGVPKITIRHDSSGQGKVADNEFATYFKGKGGFLR